MSETTKDPKKKDGIFRALDNAIGDDGLRTDIKITLTNETIGKFIAATVAATILGSCAFFMIKNLFNPQPAV